MIKLAAVLAILFFLPPLVYGQEKSRIYISPLVADGFSDEEIKEIESLLFSYLGDLGNITGPEDAEFNLISRIRLDENSRFLDIDILDAASGEYYSSYSYPFRDFGELVLKARTMLSSLFQSEQKTQAPDVLPPGERLSPERVRGTWRSGGGIQMIRLEYGGTGMLLFSSGAVMKLRYTIDRNILKVAQDSPNNERYYHYLPQKAARELVKKAEPMRWELQLFDQGGTLRGIVIFTQALYEGDSITELNPGMTDAAEWQKSR